MIGAIFGDIAGSIYEFRPVKKESIDLLNRRGFYTDDTVLTLSVAEAILDGYDFSSNL